MTAENAIEKRIEHMLAKVREAAPSEVMLSRWYRTAKGKYESAVKSGHGDGLLNDAILRNYALKEACKMYAEEKGYTLEVKR